MSKIIVLQGCPCSGKSTWTKEYLKNNDAESIDTDYFNECLDIEQGLKHIVLFG